jgi:hypothetical protein
VERRKSGNTLWMFAAVLLLAMGVTAWGAYMMAVGLGGQAVVAAGLVAVVVTLLGWATAIFLQSVHEESRAEHAADMAPINERLQHISVLLNQISEQQLITERAKGLAFRFNERDALRRAIREEIARKDYDAAMILAGDIEQAFGYKQEADRFRQEISALREGEVRKAVGDIVAVIERHCKAEEWTAAFREAERATQFFPSDPQSLGLPADIEQRRLNHKKQLIDSYQDAVNRHDVDGSIEILKKLDAYLTPAEAEPMRAGVQQIFKDKLHLIGQQFTLAVRDHKWADAIRLGEMLIKEFPNSRMAQEVREKMELLKQRESEPQAAAAV